MRCGVFYSGEYDVILCWSALKVCACMMYAWFAPAWIHSRRQQLMPKHWRLNYHWIRVQFGNRTSADVLLAYWQWHQQCAHTHTHTFTNSHAHTTDMHEMHGGTRNHEHVINVLLRWRREYNWRPNRFVCRSSTNRFDFDGINRNG